MKLQRPHCPEDFISKLKVTVLPLIVVKCSDWRLSENATGSTLVCFASLFLPEELFFFINVEASADLWDSIVYCDMVCLHTRSSGYFLTTVKCQLGIWIPYRSSHTAFLHTI